MKLGQRLWKGRYLREHHLERCATAFAGPPHHNYMVLAHNRFTGDVNLWYSPQQRSMIKTRISEATPRLFQIAERACRRLVPGDEQPIRDFEEPVRPAR